MTLERHKSKLIPDVDFSGDGRIFVTDREGTFPLRSKSQSKERGNIEDKDWKEGDTDKDRDGGSKDYFGTVWDDEDNNWPSHKKRRYLGDVGSYHSYDAKRDRKYQPKELSNYQKAMKEVTGTVSSKSSNSLSRKLKRSKSERYRKEYEGRYGVAGSVDSGSIGSGRRFRQGGPRRSAELQRQTRQYSSLDVAALRRLQKNGGGRGYDNNNYIGHKNGPGEINGYVNGGTAVPEFIPRMRRISDERLPFVIFIILGILVFICGMVLLLFSYWHLYYCLLWTGFLVFCLGLTGAFHKRDYTDKAKNISYIFLAVLCSAATMTTVALTLPVLVPSLQYIARETNLTSSVLSDISFTNQEKTLISISSMSTATMVYLTVGTSLAGLLFTCMAFFSLTAMLLALDNFWDAALLTTGECDHRGNPKFFNPLEQMSLAQATMFIGILALNLQEPNFLTYWSPFWAPFLIVLAGLCSVCYGKRPDLHGVGSMGIFIQLTAILATGVATVLCTLALVKSIEALRLDNSTTEDYHDSEIIVSICTTALFIILMIVNIVFGVGVVFRHIRHMCCTGCFDDYKEPYDPYLVHDTTL